MPQRRKFNWERVCQIREWWELLHTLPTIIEVADREGVNVKTIRSLCEGRTYKSAPVESLAERILLRRLGG